MHSIVISFFQASIEKVVALAVLMPIVASMGGNAGTQTLTVSVRALAVRELTPSNSIKIVLKETFIGGINGIIFAIIISLVSMYWFQDSIFGLIIGKRVTPPTRQAFHGSSGPNTPGARQPQRETRRRSFLTT